MTSSLEKDGGTFDGIELLPCDNALPPLDEALEAARAEVARANFSTETYSAPRRRILGDGGARPG